MAAALDAKNVVPNDMCKGIAQNESRPDMGTEKETQDWNMNKNAPDKRIMCEVGCEVGVIGTAAICALRMDALLEEKHECEDCKQRAYAEGKARCRARSHASSCSSCRGSGGSSSGSSGSRRAGSSAGCRSGAE